LDSEFAALKSTVKDKATADALQAQYDANKKIIGAGMQIEEVTEIKNDEATKVEEVNDDEAPDLEEVTIEELEKSKEEQRAKFLAKVMTETEQSKEI